MANKKQIPNIKSNTTLAQRLVNCNDTVMDADDIAIILSKSRGAVLKMCQRKQIPAHKLNRDWLFLQSEFVEWLKNH